MSKEYDQIWEKVKEDLDKDLADFFSQKDKTGTEYHKLLVMGTIVNLQLVRLLRKSNLLKKNE